MDKIKILSITNNEWEIIDCPDHVVVELADTDWIGGVEIQQVSAARNIAIKMGSEKYVIAHLNKAGYVVEIANDLLHFYKGMLPET